MALDKVTSPIACTWSCVNPSLTKYVVRPVGAVTGFVQNFTAGWLGAAAATYITPIAALTLTSFAVYHGKKLWNAAPVVPQLVPPTTPPVQPIVGQAPALPPVPATPSKWAAYCPSLQKTQAFAEIAFATYSNFGLVAAYQRGITPLAYAAAGATAAYATCSYLNTKAAALYSWATTKAPVPVINAVDAARALLDQTKVALGDLEKKVAGLTAALRPEETAAVAAILVEVEKAEKALKDAEYSLAHPGWWSRKVTSNDVEVTKQLLDNAKAPTSYPAYAVIFNNAQVAELLAAQLSLKETKAKIPNMEAAYATAQVEAKKQAPKTP